MFCRRLDFVLRAHCIIISFFPILLITTRFAFSFGFQTYSRPCCQSCILIETARHQSNSPFSLKPCLVMLAAKTDSPHWDAENGVWVGERAACIEDEILPDPLWIFGYGSLCWRPEASFSTFEHRPGRISGWARLFAQRSMDHRGTPASPGLVVTAVSDEDLQVLNYYNEDQEPSITHGVAYCIPKDKAQEVLADLDYREKGGYMRAVVEVTFTDGSGQASALLYTGAVTNPNFYLPGSLDEAAEIIATAHGPSGPNKEYLFNLADYLRPSKPQSFKYFFKYGKLKIRQIPKPLPLWK